MCTLFILICLACTYFVYCSSSTTPEPLTTNPSESTYITFAVQWKPQFCYKNTAPNCHNELIPNITIHGIWPNSYNGSHPWYCSGPELQQKDIETIQQDLEIYWPTLSNSNTNFGFWGYQWQKHGRCWYSVNATQYFQYGILWMKTEGYKDIQTILASNGIYPSNENEYLLQNVTNSLNNGLNQKSVVRCKNGKYISEFFVCRNWTAGKMDCPNNLLSNCNENVILSLQVLPDTVLPTTTEATINVTAYNYNLTGHIPVWINELHYDNAGTDIDEFVEIAGIAGTDLSDYMLYLYNGATGTQYGELSFNRVTVNSSVIPDQQNGIGTAFISINGIQNGGADGIALVYAKKYVMQFLSYEGYFIARDGPAIGMESVDILEFEASNTIINTSLSLVGSGYEYEDFEWKGGVIATPGRINIGQIITEPISETTYKPKSTYITDGIEETVERTIEETDSDFEERGDSKIDVVLIVIGCVVLMMIVFAVVIYLCRNNKGNVGMQQVPMNDMDDDIDDDTETDTQIELIGND